MVFINEFLPNPSGSDADGEWVELWNGGATPVDLSGWTLAAKGGKKFYLRNKVVGAGGYLLLPRSETKLVLHNTDGALALYDASGKLADEARFLGTAPEGKSWSREEGGRWVFAAPTPGEKNVLPALASVAASVPVGRPLNPPLGAPQLACIALGSAATLAALLLVVFRKNENLSKLFFGRDEEISREVG